MPKKWKAALADDLKGKKTEEQYHTLLEAQVELYELAEQNDFDPEVVARSAHEKRAAEKQ